MRILYDYQILLAQKYGGISRYYYELIERMRKQKDVSADIYCYFNQNAYFEGMFSDRGKDWLKRLGETRVNQKVTLFQIRKNHYDIIHPTYYDPYILDKKSGKLVITVYDMIHERYADTLGRNDPGVIEMKKKMILAANHIIAISESTKRDILEFYPEVPEEKITVVYIASNFKPSFNEEIVQRFPEKYILFVGSRDTYKNFKRFFEAVKPMLEEDQDLHLVCVGGGAFTENERTEQGPLSARVHQINAGDEILSCAYTKAQCFVFPSQYEGFGIPTLEAFACDCPVVLSNTSSMPEVGGDAVVYVDPLNAEDMRGKIREVLTDSELREELVTRGRKQLTRFDWDQIATETLECYRKVLGQ